MGIERVTFAEAVNDWRLHSMRLVLACAKAQSTHNNQNRIANLLLRDFGPTPVEDIRRPVIELYVARRRKDGISPTTINAELIVLKAILNHAVEVGHLEEAPRIKRLQAPIVEKDLPDPELVKEFVSTLPTQHRLPLLFSMLTGASWHEVERLTWGDVDFRRRVVRIGYTTPKTQARKRELPMSEAVRGLLQVRRLEGAGGSPLELVFPKAGSTRAYVNSHRTRKYGAISPAVMRKVFASMAANEVPEHILQRLLGHAPGSPVTRRHYVRSTKKQQAEVMERVGGMLA
jgi:integrase